MKAANALIVFVKNPVPGKVKTRLAASVGHEVATLIYKQLVSFTGKVASASGYPVHIYYSDFIPEKNYLIDPCASRRLQRGKDIGEKMANAIADQLLRHKKVVLIGSDCGEISSQILHHAFGRLSVADVVLGPARDGGYYLVGMKARYTSIFKGIEWSTPGVLNQTISNALHLGIDLALLAELGDVDTYKDWEALGWETPKTK
jgi:rSAM/selenodomain-associated transferase 1